jgi:hypothetical protein
LGPGGFFVGGRFACFFFGCDCGGFFLFRCGFPQFGQKETALPGREAPQ